MNNFFYKLREMFRRNPLFCILIAWIVIRNIMSVGSVWEWLYQKALLLPAIAIGLTCHEFAHAYASYKLGDPTPKMQGRLSLDPRDHFDAYGFFFLFFSGFGWGRPVEINPRYYKNRRLGQIIVSLAGVFTNLLIAIIFSFVYKGLVAMALNNSGFIDGVGGIILYIVYYIVYLNVILMVFNLIPCPPLDGWNFVSSLFNLQKYSWWYQVNSRAMLILCVVLILDIPGYIISFFGSKLLAILLV